MPTINTMRGPVDIDQLGRTLMHEHVFTLNAEIRDEYPWDEDEVTNAAVAELTDLKEHGIDAIVDLTVFGLGRNIRRVKAIADQIDLHIVPATGIYTFRDLPTYFRVREERQAGFIEEFLVREIEDGIDDTGIRPAILKVAVDRYGVTDDLESLLRATARAHRRTGVPISTHAEASSAQGLAQQRIFLEEGVDLSRVIIGHVGDAKDLSYAKRLIEGGSTVGLDRLGIDSMGTPGAVDITVDERIDVIHGLIKSGHGDKVVLGHDTHVRSDSIDRELRDEIRTQWCYTHISNDVLPRLLQAGVTQTEIDQLLIESPRRIFSQNAPY